MGGFVLTWRSAPIAALLAVVLFATGAAAGDAAAGEPLRQSPGDSSPPDLDVWRQQEQRDGLKPYPPASPGMPNPAGGLFQFGGGGRTSFTGPDLGHDGRLLTLEDAVEFFNIVLQTQLTADEKRDLVAYLRVL